jgi:dUTP pyrophosphatase
MKAVFQKIHKNAIIPKKANNTDAGYDVFSTEDYTIFKRGRVLIKLGLIWEPKLTEEEKNNEVWEIQVRPKSGLAINEGITVLNSPGTIDQDYRDEIGVIIINHSGHDVEIKKGQKIAQFIFDKKPKVEVCEGLIDLKKSPNRGGGLGSSGKF